MRQWRTRFRDAVEQHFGNWCTIKSALLLVMLSHADTPRRFAFEIAFLLQSQRANLQQGSIFGELFHEKDRVFQRETVLGTDNSYGVKDVMLYHQGIGATAPPADPLDPKVLEYVYEKNLEVVPSFGVIPVFPRMFPTLEKTPGLNIDLTKVLHGEQKIELHRPVPTAADVEHPSRIANIYDKGKATLIILAPKRQWMIIVAGTLEIGVSDGEKRTCLTGTVPLVEEPGSKGHTTRVIGDEPATLMVVELD